MPFVKLKQETLKTMRDLASLVGLPYWKYYSLVRDHQEIEEPLLKIGRRVYYDAPQTRRVIEQVAKLRDKGSNEIK